jgi:uncharacterized membrane protein
MRWTSAIQSDDGGDSEKVATGSRLGFEPSGSVSFADRGEGSSVMTLTLIYSLPDPVQWWVLALINSGLVQGIVRGRMKAGMKRFAKAMQAEHADRLVAAAPERTADSPNPASEPNLSLS